MKAERCVSTHASGGALIPALNRLDYIDGLRAVACLMVFLMHAWMVDRPEQRISVLGHRLNVLRSLMYGSTGVSLFLVLSGFCLFLSLAKPGNQEAMDIRRFGIKRAARIVPAYYAALALSIAMPFLLHVLWHHPIDLSRFPTGKSIMLHLTLFHGLFPAAFQDINGVFWSLSLEWQLYFLFPLLVWAFRRFGAMKTMTFVVALNIVYRIIAYRTWGVENVNVAWIASSNAIGRLIEFSLGMLAAWQLRRGGSHPKRPLLACCGFLFAAVVFVVLGAHDAPFHPLYDTFWGAGYFCLLRAGMIASGPLHRLLVTAPLTKLGEISYSFYLIHMLVLEAILPALASLSPIARMFGLIALAAPVTFGLALVMFRLFELPYLRASAKRKPVQASESVSLIRDADAETAAVA
jgi:peptidoglycan/LPS O-acetylase OafA/YrhL